jgi:Flp pilus assembly protein TadD
VILAEYLEIIFERDAQYWISLAYAQRRYLDLQTAERTLLEAFTRFPEEATIPFNLACYSAVDGRTLEAKSLLSKAIELDPEFKELALEDEDLVGVW